MKDLNRKNANEIKEELGKSKSGAKQAGDLTDKTEIIAWLFAV